MIWTKTASSFTDLFRCEPLRYTGAPWSAGVSSIVTHHLQFREPAPGISDGHEWG